MTATCRVPRLTGLFLVAGLALLASLLLAAEARAAYYVAGQWGGQGSGEGQFSSPAGIAIDSAGNVYVVDSGNERVQVFTPRGAFIAAWGGGGAGQGQFDSPDGIAIDPLDNVYVADTGNGRVQKLSLAGEFIDELSGSGGIGGGLDGPRGLATDAAGNLYVSDSGNDRIQRFMANGDFIDEWGEAGQGSGQFAGPRGLAIDPLNGVHVVDSGNDRVQRFSPDGEFQASTALVCFSICVPFEDPRHAAVDAAGDLFVTDSESVLIVNRPGAPGRDHRFGIGATGRVVDPSGIAIGADGSVYVANVGTNRVQRWVDDRIPPRARITKGPRGKTRKRRATFRFRSNEPRSRFRCKLDRRPFRPCRSPRTYRKLKRGRHTFRVRAIDRAGNVGPAARRSWRVR